MVRWDFKLLLGLTLIVVATALPRIALAHKVEPGTDSELSALKMKPGDQTGNDIRALKAEMLITYSENKAIKQIKKLIAKYRGSGLEPDLQFRLAELYIRRSKTDQFLEMHRDSKDVVSVVPQLVKTAASKKEIQKAIAIYDRLIHHFPDYEKLDVVIFNDAFANQQIGDDVKAEKLYRNLVINFQNSQLMPDTHLALGELEFHRHEFAKALKHYLAVRNYPNSTVYPYGMYKAAWTYYNLRDSNSAIHQLEDVIKYGIYVKKHGIDARLDLRHEALSDLALFYEDSRPSRKAYSYLAGQAGELDVSPVIMRLASLYKRHGRNSDIITLLTDFIHEKPTSNLVPLAYIDMMNASDNLHKRGDVVVLLQSLDQVCQADSDWAKGQSATPAPGTENLLADQFSSGKKGKNGPADLCRRAFNQMALGFANGWLKKWNKRPDQTNFADSAEKAFALYLKANPNSYESNKARYVYASVLFKRKKFREASKQYAIVGRQTSDPAMAHDSRYFALTALQKAVKGTWSDADEAQFRSLANEYLTKNPNGKYALDVEFQVGFIAYQKHRYDDAAPIFLKLGQKFPAEDKGIKAQDLYLDILNIKKDYPTLRSYALDLRNKCHDQTRYAKLNKIYEETYFLIIQGYEQKGDLATAIKEYNKFAQLNPNSSLTQKALWNATQLNFKSGDLEAGAEAAVNYYEKYPNTKEGLDALTKAAQSYEAMAQLKDAADVLLRLAKADSQNKTKWTLLAADFYALSGHANKARPIYETMRNAPARDTAVRALQQLEQLSESDSNPKFHEGVLKDQIKLNHQPEASLARVYFVEKSFKSGDDKTAFKLAKEVLSEERDGASREALAKARLVQARILAKEFKSQSLKSRLERVQQVLLLKTEKLSKAQIAYQSAARFGDPEVAVKAMRELGDCYLEYADGLRSMPIPKGVPDNEVQAFRDQMEKLAIPMEEKGVDAKMQAYTTAKQFEVSDKLMADLQADLKKLDQPMPADSNRFHFVPAEAVLPRIVAVAQ